MTNLISLFFWVAGWATVLWLVVVAVQWAARSNWRRRAEARAFDAIVERHRLHS